jgi:hypothetical protein
MSKQACILGVPANFSSRERILIGDYSIGRLPELEQQAPSHVHQIVELIPKQQQSFHARSLQSHYGILRAMDLNIWISASLSPGRDDKLNPGLRRCVSTSTLWIHAAHRRPESQGRIWQDHHRSESGQLLRFSTAAAGAHGP